MASIGIFLITTFGSDILRSILGAITVTGFEDIEYQRAYHFEKYQELIEKYNRNKLKLDNPTNSQFRDYIITRKLIRIESRIIKEFEIFKKFDVIYMSIQEINNIPERRNSI
jgi:RNase H-fold protein (predicted Holliday junction resolvase)